MLHSVLATAAVWMHSAEPTSGWSWSKMVRAARTRMSWQ
jgi:hypothetical protein